MVAGSATLILPRCRWCLYPSLRPRRGRTECTSTWRPEG